MNILVLGSGAREHAIVWKCRQSNLVNDIYAYPGNPGISKIATCIKGDLSDFENIKEIVKKNNIELVIVGPEAPLVAGIVDYLSKEGVMAFGPDKSSAQLEGSKVFSKNLLKKHHISTAEFESFSNFDEAMKFVDQLAHRHGYPIVIKADGLAAGKGVVIVNSRAEAEETLSSIMNDKIFGAAGENVLIEEFLDGVEASIHVILSGENYFILPASQDHKRVYDNDEGLNTGGMGAYSPCPIVDENMNKKIQEMIITPLIDAFKKEDIDYKGVLYIGLMLVNDVPYVLEFNVRFGDPETQVLLPIIDEDLVDIAIKTVRGELSTGTAKWNKKYAVAITCAAKGYPGEYEKGKEIIGLDKFDNIDDAFVFHAGTKLENDKIVTNGGRVLSLVGTGDAGGDLKSTIAKTYLQLEKIYFDGMHFRRDIGQKALK